MEVLQSGFLALRLEEFSFADELKDKRRKLLEVEEVLAPSAREDAEAEKDAA